MIVCVNMCPSQTHFTHEHQARCSTSTLLPWRNAQWGAGPKQEVNYQLVETTRQI